MFYYFKSFLILFFLLALSITSLYAKEIDLSKVDIKKTVDLRTDKSPNNWYMLIFFARDKNPSVESKKGHAYIAALKFREDINSFVTESVFGLYPYNGKNWLLDFIDTDGSIGLEPADEEPEAALIVWVNKNTYDQSLSVRDSWKKEGEWIILIKDCVSLLAEISKVVGLKKPKITTVYPIDYVKELINKN